MNPVEDEQEKIVAKQQTHIVVESMATYYTKKQIIIII
jgi:hypothetical protein